MPKITNPIVIGIVRRCKPITLLLTTCGSAENEGCMGQSLKNKSSFGSERCVANGIEREILISVNIA